MATENALERFVRKTRTLFAEEADPEKRWTSLRPVLSELLADQEVVEASKNWPDCVYRDGRAENLLFYEDPDYGFAVNGLTSTGGQQQGRPANAHDHGRIYTLYGLLDGHQEIVLYERTDDRSRPDYAEVSKTSDYQAGPGDIHMARPREIHTEVNTGERTAAVIIRSEKDGGPSNLHGRYELNTNKYHESVGPRQTPVEMLPKAAIAR